MENIYTKINKMYNKKTYLASYGLDILITIVICLIFFVATSYFYIMNNLKPIVADWSNQKCSPAVIPFAGLINNGTTTTPMEFTEQNFTNCIQTILGNITGYAFAPIYYLMQVITDAFQELVDAIDAIRSEFDVIRNAISNFAEEIMSKILNVVMPLVTFIIASKDMAGKAIGTLTASLYTLIGSYLGLSSLLLFIVKLVLEILIVLAFIVVASWVLAVFVPPAATVAIGNTVIMTAIMVPIILMKVFMDDVMSLSTGSPPSIPSCFAEETIISLAGRKKKKISSIKVGDKLADGSIVTGIMELSSSGQEIYKLDGVTVTGNHSIYHEEKGWIRVYEHPRSCSIDDFREPYVYCLNTNTKTIKIGKNTYADWDDLDDMDISELRVNCADYGLLPREFKNKDIHTYLDAGLHEFTLIELEDGQSVNIKNICVNDILRFGEKVVGIVKIDATDIIGVYEYILEDGSKIKGSGNIQVKDPSLGNFNTFDLEGKEISNTKYLYHLLTDRGDFVVNGIRLGDYNSGIEKYISSDGARNISEIF
jgi:hypothetical protein|tara:strand:- start:11085 stop:12698 length:1614 start_codon:yes stop_codon:yes gene_type:complete